MLNIENDNSIGYEEVNKKYNSTDKFNIDTNWCISNILINTV